MELVYIRSTSAFTTRRSYRCCNDKVVYKRFDSKTYLFTEGSIFLDILGSALGGILKGASIDKIFPRKECPFARMAIDQVQEDNGWFILDGLTKAILPRCGAESNLISKVENLTIYPPSPKYRGDTLMDFINRANKCE